MVAIVKELEEVVEKGTEMIKEEKRKTQEKAVLKAEIEELSSKIDLKGKYIDDLMRAAIIVGNVADENTRKTLEHITGVINSALQVLFKEDKRRISIKQVPYRNIYTHFVVELVTETGVKRSFKQSGTGLAQVISFLFTVCLIDARKGRKIMVMDELLNGLHPTAKKVVKGVMEVLSDRFQFVVVEYGMDIGREFEVLKEGSEASVFRVEDDDYYRELNKKQMEEGE